MLNLFCLVGTMGREGSSCQRSITLWTFSIMASSVSHSEMWRWSSARTSCFSTSLYAATYLGSRASSLVGPALQVSLEQNPLSFHIYHFACESKIKLWIHFFPLQNFVLVQWFWSNWTSAQHSFITSDQETLSTFSLWVLPQRIWPSQFRGVFNCSKKLCSVLCCILLDLLSCPSKRQVWMIYCKNYLMNIFLLVSSLCSFHSTMFLMFETLIMFQA